MGHTYSMSKYGVIKLVSGQYFEIIVRLEVMRVSTLILFKPKLVVIATSYFQKQCCILILSQIPEQKTTLVSLSTL